MITPALGVQLAAADLSRLSIEELANIDVTSVSRTPEPVSAAPAAIYVITADAIRRSGAHSIPEVLRLAPNLQVAQNDAATYAISARGFNHNTSTSNKLQVLIDGRIVYSPLFSGTFWDEQNLVIADIDRVEVISGPGGTLWGANAVNGVINIVTKHSADTKGALAEAYYGTSQRGFETRYGGALGEEGSYRLYAMGFDRGPSKLANGNDATDEWDNLKGGFRADWSRAADALMLEGDIYKGTSEHVTAEVQTGSIAGGDIIGRWNHTFADESQLQAQLYYNNTRRNITSGVDATVNTYDADAQYNFTAGSNAFVIGGGYRDNQDSFSAGPGTAFLSPAERHLTRSNIFVQDQIALTDALDVTLGLKFEHNSYTGWEYMPDARIAYKIFDNALLWATVSRAVRTPSRFDRDFVNPGLLSGGPNFDSENVIAYEGGYRGQPAENLSLSISGFYNVYDSLRTVEASGPFVFPLVVLNGMRGHTYGIEAWADAALTDWWRISAGVSTLHKDLKLAAGSLDIFGIGFAGNDPHWQAQLRSDMDLGPAELELALRGVGELPSPVVASYAELNAKLAWRVADAIELSLTGFNLLHKQHVEFINPALGARAIPRSVEFGARWEF